MTNLFNDLIVLSAEKKKKGGGINAMLTLMKEMIDFQDEIQKCAEAQDLAENKQKVLSFMDQIERMYSELVDMVRPAIRSTSQPALPENVEQVEQVIEETPTIEKRTSPASSQVKRPIAPSM